MLKGRILFSALTGVCALLCVSILISSYGLTNKSVLDQYEIGEYDIDPHEAEVTEREYDAAQPWRDPGHISREEIRFSRALRSLDTVPRDDTWSAPPLWAKYDQAMQDPSEVRTGWSNPRHLTPGADPLQRAVERHGYGAEGHRQPERTWSLDSDEDSDINNVLEDSTGGTLNERKRAYLARLIAAVRTVATSVGFDPYEAPPRRAAEVGAPAPVNQAASAIVHEMQGLREDIRKGISAAASAAKAPKAHSGTSVLGQQLAASQAEVKALERTDKDLEKDDATQKRRLARLEKAIRELRRRRAAHPSPASNTLIFPVRRHRGMSDIEAARDINSYFDKLSARTMADSAAHVQSELAQAEAFGAITFPVRKPTPVAAVKAATAKTAARHQTLAELIKSL